MRESAQQCATKRSVLRLHTVAEDARTRKMESSLLVVLLAGACWSAPADEPVRIDLPVYDQPQASSDLIIAQPFEAENYPGGEALIGDVGAGNFVTYKLQAVSGLLDSKAKANFDFGGPFSAPVTSRETVLQETEGIDSKPLSFKENIQNIVAGIFQPKPIVDTISESEKYGNTGDKFYSTGKALVGGAENVSNLVNSVLEVPATILKKISRVTTEKLNNLGGRLIGL